jgi:putative membrane protein
MNGMAGHMTPPHWGRPGFLLVFLFWALAIAGILAIIKWIFQADAGRGDSPLDVVKKRYARGEISREEFEEKKKDLS